MKRGIIVISLLILLLTGCKSKQTIQERYITTVDSTAVVVLSQKLEEATKENIQLKGKLESVKEENSKLTSDMESHTVNYDTTAPVNPETGKYPIASETTTVSKSVFDKTIKEYETLTKEYKREVNALTQRSSNLEYELTNLRGENRELKSKTVRDGFSIKWYLFGVLSGAAVMIVVFIYFRKR